MEQTPVNSTACKLCLIKHHNLERTGWGGVVEPERIQINEKYGSRINLKRTDKRANQRTTSANGLKA